jgi:hypothetical protein
VPEAARQGAARGAAGAAHVQHLAALDRLSAAVNPPDFVAVVGVERTAGHHLDQAADDRGV